jgi:Mn2+/Fe2+ NRAMP family transporter
MSQCEVVTSQREFSTSQCDAVVSASLAGNLLLVADDLLLLLTLLQAFLVSGSKKKLFTFYSHSGTGGGGSITIFALAAWSSGIVSACGVMYREIESR